MSIHFDDLLVHCRAYVANRTSDSREDSLWLDRVDQTVADLRAALSSGGPMLGVDATAAWNRRTPAPSQTAVEPVALAQALKNLTEGAEQEDREILYAAASTLTAQAAALVAAEKALRARNQDALIWQSLCKDGEIALRAAESEVATLKARIAELEAGLDAAEAYNEEHGDPADTLHHGRSVLDRARRLAHQEKNNGR